MRQTILRNSWAFTKCLLLYASYIYITLCILLLALRFVVLPNIDYWRSDIQSYLTEQLQFKTELGPLLLHWQGWSPILEVNGLRLFSTQGQEILSIPGAQARFNWPALLPGEQGPLRLQIWGMDINLVRSAAGKLNIPILQNDDTEQLADNLDGLAPDAKPLTPDPLLQWLLAQPYLAMHETTLRWSDHTRDGKVLVLRDVDVSMVRKPGASLRLGLSARAESAGNAGLQIRAELFDPDVLLHGVLPAKWRAWMQINSMQAADWRSWADIPEGLQQARLDLQMWAESEANEPLTTVLLKLEQLKWGSADAADLIKFRQAAVWAQTGLADLRYLARHGRLASPLDFQIKVSGLSLELPEYFDHTLFFDQAYLDAAASNSANGRLRLDNAQLSLANPDLRLAAKGWWNSTGIAGHADISGSIDYVDMAALHRYMPLEVDADARSWLATGIKSGRLRAGNWLVRGDLAEFPYGDNPAAGDFKLAGVIDNVTLDFVPDADLEEAWPLLQNIVGQASLRRMALNVQAEQAQMLFDSGQKISFDKVQADIPDLENNTTLYVAGNTRGDGQAYMDFLRASPVGRMINDIFHDAKATGHWQVPLKLTIPLLHSIDTEVSGKVQLDSAALQLFSGMPWLSGIAGEFDFNEYGVELPKPVLGKLLGGTVQINGKIGAKSDPGLRFNGRIIAADLAKFVAVPGMRRITGQLDYQAALAPEKNHYEFVFNSDTKGLQLDFPAPLGKPAKQVAKLQAKWSDAGSEHETIEVSLSDAFKLYLRHPTARKYAGPYFDAVSFALGGEAALLPATNGQEINIVYPLFDLDLWDQIGKEFDASQAPATGSKKHGLWPAISSFSVQAEQLRVLGTRLDQAAIRALGSSDGNWSVNIRSEQSNGTLKWQFADGRIVGRLKGNFGDLSLGDDGSDSSSLLPDQKPFKNIDFEEDLDIPGILLQAENLRIYGHDLGALLLEGELDSSAKVWNLSNLRIGDASARLQGTGLWRLKGPDRGLGLKAKVLVTDLGAWMDKAGWDNILANGQGEIKGQFNWNGLPWSMAQEDLSGSVDIQLENGRIEQLGSGSAKFLEVLSLQSVTRLFSLNQGLAGLLQQGLPFDQFRGNIKLANGLAEINDYKVIGPVGTIILDGSAHIIQQTLDLDAVVVPNLDASGAAIAAGIAINPLVGIGAFLGQWLLKTPLAKAMTQRYNISGSWDDPQLKEVSVSE